MTKAPLRLRAEDTADLDILSAASQDALFQLADLEYDARARRFSAVLMRFRWENERSGAPFERIRSLLCIDDVANVRSKNVRLGAREAIGSLLAIRFTHGEEAPEGEIALVLAGDGEVRLAVGCIDVTLTDVGEPWRTDAKPQHEQA